MTGSEALTASDTVISVEAARGLVTDEIGSLRVARLSTASRPGSLRERRVAVRFAMRSVMPELKNDRI
jgi:hypothetical protein